jgi:uncharacterized protein (DUF488 family)
LTTQLPASRYVGAEPYHDWMAASSTVWTVGHSNHDFERFFGLLQVESVSHLIDIRSFPYSRHAPQFNREELQSAVEARGLRYVFLGLALGGRPQRQEHFDSEGHALYAAMAQEPAFCRAIERLASGAAANRLALVCSCGRPDECHRRLLVGKVLCEHGVTLRHILPDGSVTSESTVPIAPPNGQDSLFGHDVALWRSTRSVSRRQRLSVSSAA